MFNKIVWATDGSPSADLALPELRKLANGNGSSVVVLHCQETMVGPHAYGETRFPDEENVKAKIRRQVDQMKGEGLDVSARFVSTHAGAGVAAHAIADAAREEHADLIVVGTRGHTVLGGLLVGSVTQRLLHIAPCPVLAVRGEDGAG